MPFGKVNSCATMTRCMRKMLSGMENVTCYVDDILVHTHTWEEHTATLREVLQQANLTARPSKCVIGAETMDFVGHRVGKGMIEPQEVNVRKVKDAPRPVTKKEVRSFLGLMGFYREYIPDYAAIAAPLTDATKKGQPNIIMWRDPHERSYSTLYAAVASRPILRLPDHRKEFIRNRSWCNINATRRERLTVPSCLCQ